MIHRADLGRAARRAPLRQIFVPAWAVLACGLFLLHAPAEIRAPIAIVFFCFVPGAALVGLFRTDSLSIELSLSVALSVAITGLTAGILLYSNLWSPTTVVVTVTVISVAGGLRDLRLGRREPDPAVSALAPFAQGPPVGTGALPAVILQLAQWAGRAAGSASGGIAAVPWLSKRRELSPPHRTGSTKPSVEPQAAASPLQGFLLNELRQRNGSPAPARRRRQPPPSLANLEPHELSDLLSWSSLQRYVTQRAIREVRPELLFVEDLERQFKSQTHEQRLASTPRAPRGVWITGVSPRTSVPVAWRVLTSEGNNDWRVRLALELIDELPQPGLGEAVLAADTDYGSLSGLRQGLAERSRSYLLRVDPVTAARDLDPDKPSGSAAEARDLLQRLIAAQPQPHVAQRGSELVLLQASEQILICEAPVAGKNSVFWLSNLPAATAPERLVSLVQLANRSDVARATPDLLQVALKMAAQEGTGLDRELALVALAGGLQTLNASARRADEQR